MTLQCSVKCYTVNTQKWHRFIVYVTSQHEAGLLKMKYQVQKQTLISFRQNLRF